jgi:hypothetical protein
MTTDHDPDRFPESGGQDGKAGPRRKTIDSPYIHRLQRRHFLVFCAWTVIDRHPITVGLAILGYGTCCSSCWSEFSSAPPAICWVSSASSMSVFS